MYVSQELEMKLEIGKQSPLAFLGKKRCFLRLIFKFKVLINGNVHINIS